MVRTDIQTDFPILSTKVNGRRLVYLDNAASAQKPRRVIDALTEYYQATNSNVHRGAHFLSAKATDAFESARETAAAFIGAPESALVNFSKGTTDGINLIASAYGRKFLQPGDEVLMSGMEHHSNIVPWQMACQQTGASLKVVPVDENGEMDMAEFDRLLGPQTRIVPIVWASNSLGTINPVVEIIEKAHKAGAHVMLDAAQAATHLPIDVQALDCDFLVFSGHKLFGPTGTGICYGKRELLEAMDPYQGGGEMIKEVRFEKTTYNELPFKFEAGTPNIAGAVGLAAAMDYVNEIGFDRIAEIETELLQAATDKLSSIDGLRIVGTASEKVSVVSFLIEGTHPYDIGVLLDKQGIAIRTGHHCCQPLMQHYGIEGTARASFAFYNTLEEVDLLEQAIRKAKDMLV